MRNSTTRGARAPMAEALSSSSAQRACGASSARLEIGARAAMDRPDGHDRRLWRQIEAALRWRRPPRGPRSTPIESQRADVAQLVEHWLPKPGVVGSSPIVRFTRKPWKSRVFSSSRLNAEQRGAPSAPARSGGSARDSRPRLRLGRRPAPWRRSSTSRSGRHRARRRSSRRRAPQARRAAGVDVRRPACRVSRAVRGEHLSKES